MCLRYHPKDPNFLYAGTAEGHVYLINTETGELQHIITGKLESFNTVRPGEGALAAHPLGLERMTEAVKAHVVSVIETARG